MHRCAKGGGEPAGNRNPVIRVGGEYDTTTLPAQANGAESQQLLGHADNLFRHVACIYSHNVADAFQSSVMLDEAQANLWPWNPCRALCELVAADARLTVAHSSLRA